MGQGGSATKSPADLRLERYASYIKEMQETLTAYERGQMPKDEALRRCDDCVERIRTIGRVDGDKAREHLRRLGIDDQTRVELENSYNLLKKPLQTRMKKMGGCC